MEVSHIPNLSRYRDLLSIRQANPPISRQDRWRPEDPNQKDVWHLDGHLPGYGKVTIGWDFDAPDGIIDVLKLAAAALFLGEHPRYDHRSANIFAQSVKYLAAFMVAH
jgi:hypothetical protein